MSQFLIVVALSAYLTGLPGSPVAKRLGWMGAWLCAATAPILAGLWALEKDSAYWSLFFVFFALATLWAIAIGVRVAVPALKAKEKFFPIGKAPSPALSRLILLTLVLIGTQRVVMMLIWGSVFAALPNESLFSTLARRKMALASGEKELEALCVWAKTQTQKQSLFLVPPDASFVSFRNCAERSLFINHFEIAQLLFDIGTLPEALERQQLAESYYSEPAKREQLAFDLVSRWQVNYVVLEHADLSHTEETPPVYSDNKYAVYALPPFAPTPSAKGSGRAAHAPNCF